MAMGWTVVGVTNDELDSLAATRTIAARYGGISANARSFASTTSMRASSS
ncbi:MAG: hypothetical protein V8S24_05945 [Gordonibacter pamelaeae]